MAVMRCDFDYNLNYNGGLDGRMRRGRTSDGVQQAINIWGSRVACIFHETLAFVPITIIGRGRKVPAPGTPTPDFHFPGDANNHHRHSSSSAPMESAGGLLLLLLTHGYTWTYNDTFEVRIMCRWWDWWKPCIFVWEYSSRNLPLHFLFFSVFHS